MPEDDPGYYVVQQQLAPFRFPTISAPAVPKFRVSHKVSNILVGWLTSTRSNNVLWLQ